VATNTLSYYNTNKETGNTLSNSRYRAKSQEEIILSIFREGDLLSPDEVLNICNTENNYLLTSIRRALTNLTNKGLLIKNNVFKIGGYGKKTHTWSLSERSKQ
jgi:Fe2+ or Zn2+ uptake regulation protein